VKERAATRDGVAAAMKTYPYTVENGAGERITFTGIVRDSDGVERIVGEAIAQPTAGPPMHIHYLEEEGFTVTTGCPSPKPLRR
jgi:hypothetical protein